MGYEIYIDSLFVRNVVLNLCLLSLLRACSGKRTKPLRILAGALAGAALCVLPLLLPIPMYISFPAGMLCGMAGMLCLTFQVRGIRAFAELFWRAAYLSFLTGGLLLLLRTWLPTRVLGGAGETVVLALGFVLCLAGGGVLRRIRRRPTVCDATLRNRDRSACVKALWDSGNNLAEPISGSPVCVIDETLFPVLWEEGAAFLAIPFHTVGCPGGILRGYRLEELRVQEEGEGESGVFRNVWVAVSPEPLRGAVKMILNPGISVAR